MRNLEREGGTAVLDIPWSYRDVDRRRDVRMDIVQVDVKMGSIVGFDLRADALGVATEGMRSTIELTG